MLANCGHHSAPTPTGRARKLCDVCAREKRRAGDRLRHRARYREDAEFRAREKQRVTQHRRGRAPGKQRLWFHATD